MLALSVTKRLQWFCLKSGHAAPLHIFWNSVFLSYSTTQRYTVRFTESDVEITLKNKWMEHLMNVLTCYLLVLSCVCCPHSTSKCLRFLRFISLISSYRHSTLYSLCHLLRTIFTMVTTLKHSAQKYTNQWAGWAILGISTFYCSWFMKKRNVKNLFLTMKKTSHWRHMGHLSRRTPSHIQHSYNTGRNFIHMLDSRYATLAIQSCELPQGPHCD